MSRVALGRLVETAPHLLSMNVSRHLRPTLSWLVNLGVPQDRLERIIRQVRGEGERKSQV